jgi:hypothetical protein
MTKSEMLLRAASDFKAVVTAHNHVSIAALLLTVLTNILGSNSWNTWDTCNRSARLYFRPETDSSSSYSSELSARCSHAPIPSLQVADSLSHITGKEQTYLSWHQRQARQRTILRLFRSRSLRLRTGRRVIDLCGN